MSELLEKIIGMITGSGNTAQPNANDLSKNKALADQLKAMEDAYNNSKGVEEPNYDELYPKDSGLYKKEYEPLSEEELLKEAEDSLASSYQKNIEDLTTTTDYKMDKLSQKEQNTLGDMAEDVGKVFANAEEQNQDLTHAMINKGTVYSSIYDEGKKDIEEVKDFSLQKINADYDTALSEIRYEMDYLNLTYQNSLQYYELKYAEDLEKKLSSLKLAEEKRLEEINKYNLNIMKEEEKYQKERQEQIEKDKQLIDELNQLKERAENATEGLYGMSSEKKSEMDSRYELAYNFYSQYDKDVALKLLRENYDALVETLGIDYFNKLFLTIGG